MDNNNPETENIIQIFNNNLKFIDRTCAIKVFYELIKKDKNGEMNLEKTIADVVDEESGNCDNMETDDVSTKQDSHITNNNNQQTNSNSEKFSSSNENAPNSFKDSNEDKSKEISQIAEEIFDIIKDVHDEKDRENILSQVLNYFMTKSYDNI